MTDINTYAPPESEVATENENLTISGWLRFYQITNYFSLILGTILVICIPISLFFIDNLFEKELDVVALLFEITPSMLFSFLIVKVIKIRETHIPAKIKKYIGGYVVMSLLITLVLRYLYSLELITDKPTATFLGDIIYYAIWVSYFKRSKRVAEYYGQNV